MLQLLPLFNPDAVTAPAGFQERTSVLENLTNAGTIERMTAAKATVAAEAGDYLG
jgi:hypothetical protein